MGYRTVYVDIAAPKLTNKPEDSHPDWTDIGPGSVRAP